MRTLEETVSLPSFRPGTSTTTYTGQSGDMLGVAVGKDREGKNTIKTTIQLKEVKNVKLSDFFESQGATYVNTYGRTYRVADNVECYYNRTGNKVSKELPVTLFSTM